VQGNQSINKAGSQQVWPELDNRLFLSVSSLSATPSSNKSLTARPVGKTLLGYDRQSVQELGKEQRAGFPA
jgi:hypothetical protein